MNGKKICIIGPSNSGKSTLANKISKEFNLPLLHLDQIAHIPNTNWERSNEKEFTQQHDKFIQQNAWIVEGNYSICMPQRFACADTVIWCDPPLSGCIWRYIFRSFKNDKHRIGNLKNAKKQFSFNLIKYTLINYPKNRTKYENLLNKNSHLNIFKLRTWKEVQSFI